MPRLLLLLLLITACSTPNPPGQYSTEDTIIPNGPIRLSARIYKPGGQGPFPAAILLHGSENHTKDYYTEYSEYFAAHGIVVANYDKRGQGQSTGNLWTSTFQDLAGDAVEVVDHLALLPYVDNSRIGLWADSQGGWVALLADSLSSRIDFIINKSGPAVTPLAQTLYDTRENYLEPDGVPANIQDELLNLYPQILEYLTRNREEALWDEIHRQLNRFAPTPYFKESFDEYYLSLLNPPEEMKTINEVPLDPSGRDYDFDPASLLQKLDTPMLMLYGTADELVDIQESAGIIRKIQNPAIELKIYPKADHGIRIHRKPGFLLKPCFPEGYLDSLVKFIITP
ncbi:MAG: alpha/beta fold hydrolase [Lewinellaceae bacterium]|nr:alpha/beta fold hydrolase [Lewinellaceae bacterium]